MRDQCPIILIEAADGSRRWLRAPRDGDWDLTVWPEYDEWWGWGADRWRHPTKQTGNVDLKFFWRDAHGDHAAYAYGRLVKEATPRGRELWRITEPPDGHFLADGTFVPGRVAGL